jgi:Bacterial Ig-like domain
LPAWYLPFTGQEAYRTGYSVKNRIKKGGNTMKNILTGCLMVLFLAGFMAGCGGGGGDENFLPSTTDDTAPTVSSTEPADGATDVAINRKILATFDEAMIPDRITDAGTFTLTGPGGAVAGTVRYNVVNRIAIFTPSGDLSVGLHTATITTAARDVSDNALAAANTWSFVVDGSDDITPPVVITTSPADNATNVSTRTDINVTFNEVMDPETINLTTFTLETTAGSIHVPGFVTCAGTAATFNPTAPLLPGIEYIARLTIEVADLAGNTFPTEIEWSFTTD